MVIAGTVLNTMFIFSFDSHITLWSNFCHLLFTNEERYIKSLDMVTQLIAGRTGVLTRPDRL